MLDNVKLHQNRRDGVFCAKQSFAKESRRRAESSRRGDDFESKEEDFKPLNLLDIETLR